MSDVPSHDRWNSVYYGSLTDKTIIEPCADPATSRVASNRFESLWGGQADKAGDGPNAFQRRPGFFGCKLKRCAISPARQSAICLGVTMRGDGELRLATANQQIKGRTVMLVSLHKHRNQHVAVDQRINRQDGAREPRSEPHPPGPG